jgi:hypothetical protein
MRRLGELRWRVVAGEVEVELQDQVNRSGRPRDPRLPDIHTLVCLEFLRAAAGALETLAVGGAPGLWDGIHPLVDRSSAVPPPSIERHRMPLPASVQICVRHHGSPEKLVRRTRLSDRNGGDTR